MSLAQTLALQQALKNQQAQAQASKQASNSQPAPTGALSPTGPDPATTPYRVVPHQDGSSSLYVQQGYKATVVNQTTNPETGAVTRQYAIEPVLPQSTSQPISNDLFSGKRQGMSIPNIIDLGTTQPIVKNNEQRVEAIITIATLPLAGSGGLVRGGAKAVATNLAKQAVIGGGIGAGLEYVSTGKVTVENVLVSAGTAVALNAVGGKIIREAGFIGKGLVDTTGRVGVNTLLGGGAGVGIEVIKTGKATPQGFLEGEAFGAAFGLAGEAIGRVGPRVQTKLEPVAENIRERTVYKNQGILNKLDTANTKYESAVSEAKPFKPTLAENLAMKVTGVRPSYSRNIDIRLMPTLETSMNAATETGFEGIKIDAPNVPNKMGAPGKSFEGTVILDQRGVQAYKNWMATEATDAANSFFGFSEPPTTRPGFKGSETPANLKALEFNSKNRLGGGGAANEPVKVSVPKSSEATTFETNRNVDDYLADHYFSTKDINTEYNPSEIFSSKNGSSNKSPNLYEPQTQTEPVASSNKKPYMETPKFEEAENLINKNFTKEDMKIIEDINATENVGQKGMRMGFDGYAVEPTGGVKIVSDIFSNRTIDTGRMTPEFEPFIPSFQRGSWGRRDATISPPKIKVDVTLKSGRNGTITNPATNRKKQEIENARSNRNQTSTNIISNSFWENRKQRALKSDKDLSTKIYPQTVALTKFEPLTKNKTGLETRIKTDTITNTKPLALTETELMTQPKTSLLTEQAPYTEVSEQPITRTPETSTSIILNSTKFNIPMQQFKTEGNFLNSFSNPKAIGIGKRVRYYAVADPLKVAGEFF